MSTPTYFRQQEAISITENRLPHWEQDDTTYFLTFRLADSLPSGLLAQWREEREQWMRHNPEPWNPVQEAEYHEVFSRQKERWLDAGHGECHLADPAVRRPVREAILARQTGVDVWSLVIMPNHVHVLLSVTGARPLAHVLKTWKGTSARAANLARNSSGSFWGKDYFDRLIRDEAHFWSCARYIRRNPEKAGLLPNGFALEESGFVRNILDGTAAGHQRTGISASSASALGSAVCLAPSRALRPAGCLAAGYVRRSHASHSVAAEKQDPRCARRLDNPPANDQNSFFAPVSPP